MPRPLLAAVLVALATCAPALAAENGISRYEAAARAVVTGCAEDDKVMTHDPGRDRMIGQNILIQTWTGACRGDEDNALTIVCPAHVVEGEVECFIR